MAEPPALLTAINLTLTTIDQRIKLYRGLVVCVIVIVFGVPLLGLYLGDWLVLLGEIVVVPAVVVYFYVDKHVVQRWAKHVHALSSEKNLDLRQFQTTMTSFRHIPAATLKTMLALIS